MAIKWTNKSAINREIDMAERHTDRGSGSHVVVLCDMLCIWFCVRVESWIIMHTHSPSNEDH